MLEDSSFQVESPQAPVDMESDDICWICLDGTKDRDPLINPCRCPRKVHPRCLARWQLQQAGRLEETNCRFCQSNLADWKASLTPENLKPDVQRVQPIMVVYFEGQIHRIPVKQGPDGLKEFTHRIRELFRLPDDVDISLTFGCKEPLSGQHLKLEGIGAFDAAVHCASVAAAERQQKLKSGGGTGGAGAAAGPGGAGPETPAATADSTAGAMGSPVANTAGASAASAAGTQLSGRAAEYTMQPHHYHHHNYQSHLNRAPSAAAGVVSAPSSAPVSAQTSGGGADAATSGGGGSLHATASAPVLNHYGSDSNLLATAAATASAAAHTHLPLHPSSPSLGREGSLQGCVSLPEQPASGRSSSGGGAKGREQQPQQERPLQGLRSTAAAAATTAFTHRAMAQQASGEPMGSPSPFHFAARDGSGPAVGVEAQQPQQTPEGFYMQEQQRRQRYLQQQQHQPECPPPPLVSQFTVPISHQGVQESPLRSSLSEPFAAGGSNLEVVPQLTTHHTGTPFACAPSPSSCQQGTSSPPSTPPQQPPAGSACSGFPYSMPFTSPYAAPLLPPLLTPTSSGNSSAHHIRRGSDLPLEQRPASPSLSPSPSLAAAATVAPLTPRDHYVACRDADGRSDAASGMSYMSYTYPQRHQRQPSLTSGYLASKHQEQQQQPAVARDIAAASGMRAMGSAAAASAATTTTPALAGASGKCADDGIGGTSSVTTIATTTTTTTTSTASVSANSAVGPATPSHPILRRTATPTSAPRLPQPGLVPSSNPPMVSAVLSSRHHPYLGSAGDPDNLAATPRMLTAGGCGGGAAAATPACDDGNRRMRRTTTSRSEYDTAAILPCTAADDSAALGSLTGRLKFSLRAFSRKVARSLNFQRSSAGHGVGCGAVRAASVAGGMMPSLAGGAAVSEAGVLLPQADAEAEVEEVTEVTASSAAAPVPTATAAVAAVSHRQH